MRNQLEMLESYDTLRVRLLELLKSQVTDESSIKELIKGLNDVTWVGSTREAQAYAMELREIWNRYGHLTDLNKDQWCRVAEYFKRINQK